VFQSKSLNATDKVTVLGDAANSDAGLLVDWANWLRDTNQSIAARTLLARPRTLTNYPADATKFYETLLAVAKGAVADGQWEMAYRIASQIDDAYPPGTDVSAQSYSERDKYTSLAWLAGMIALYRLDHPADAINMFERYAKAARSPQTRTKGFYWAGRAATEARQADRASNFFALAAQYPDQFYGQLSLERIGREILPPAPATTAALAPATREAFARKDIVEATRFLGQQGRYDEQSLFIRALSDNLRTDEDRMLAGEFAREINRPDLGVWVARSARNNGASIYTRAGFPEMSMPPAYTHLWTLSHAITRQESSFDRAATSSAGARGMMQLMPGTARSAARSLGVTYEPAQLTSDPSYNVLLGSKYFADLMESFGNYPPLAIAAYNAGPANVRRWIRDNGDPRLPDTDVVRWIEEIPFFETRNYVQRVLENAVIYDSMNPSRARSSANMRLSYYLGKRRPG
jgi:soluble lytic murein transglycosylase